MSKPAVAAVALVVACAAFALLRRGAPAGAARGLVPSTPAPEAPLGAELERAARPASAARSQATSSDPAPPAPVRERPPPDAPVAAAPPDPPPYHLGALLVDRDGVALPGLVVSFTEAGTARCVETDVTGSFDGGPCPDATPRTLEVRFSGAPRASYGDHASLALAPVTARDPFPVVAVPHGPRVLVDVALPVGARPEEFAVEFQHAPAFHSSQIGFLGGCGTLNRGPRGLWAWAPPIRNSVRGKGAGVRVLSLDGLWASPSAPVTDAHGAPLERRIENDDEVWARVALQPTGAATVHVDPVEIAGDRVEVLLVRSEPGDHGGGHVMFGSFAAGAYRFHWLEPGSWIVRPGSRGVEVLPGGERLDVVAGRVVETSVALRAE